MTLHTAVNTERKRKSLITDAIEENFKRVGKIELHDVKEFNNGDPSKYWIFTFRTPAIKNSFRLHTATLSNDASIDFNLHSIHV